MRPIHTARLAKVRPGADPYPRSGPAPPTRVTVAPITSTVRGLSTEVPVGPANGLDQQSVVSCDNIVTIPTSALGQHLGYLFPAQETALSQAIQAAFDLD